MNYHLVYTRRAEKDIKKLDPFTKSHIGKALLRLQENPIGHSEKLTEPKIETYRFRIGNYRVIWLFLISKVKILLSLELDIERKFTEDFNPNYERVS